MQSEIIPRALSWTDEPTLPEHLQWHDAYGEDLVAAMMQSLAEYAWGVSELMVDVNAGVLHVSRVVARLQSGIEIERCRPDEGLMRALGPEFDGRAEMDVYLGIARVAPNAPNVTDDPTMRNAPRFVRTEENELAPLVRILFDDEDSDSERIPIARVVRKGSAVTISPWHLPPMLRIPVGSALLPKLDALTEVMKARQSRLLSSRGNGDGRFEEERLSQLDLLSSLSATLAEFPRLRQHGAPEPLFRCLVDLLGAIEDLDPLSRDFVTDSELPIYVHDDPGPGFRDLLDRLTALVPKVARDRHLEIPLRRSEQTVFRATAPNARAFKQRVFLVASGAGLFWSNANVPAYAKVAAEEHLRALVERSLPGVLVGVAFDAPPFIPNGPLDACFAFDQNSTIWKQIEAARTLSVYLPNAPDEFELTLYSVED